MFTHRARTPRSLTTEQGALRMLRKSYSKGDYYYVSTKPLVG